MRRARLYIPRHFAVIEVFRNKRPDVTLMDLQMPELNGIDGIATIRQEQPQARIIVLTGLIC